MENKSKWKTVAIIFIVLFSLETLFLVWAYYTALQEQVKTEKCYYNICAEYPEAQLDGNVCFCYDYDLVGNLGVAKTKIME